MIARSGSRVRPRGVQNPRHVHVLRTRNLPRLEWVGDSADAGYALLENDVDVRRAVTRAACSQLEAILADRGSARPRLHNSNRERPVVGERLVAVPELVGDGDRRTDDTVAGVVD